MRRQMAHRVRPSARGDRPARRRPVDGTRRVEGRPTAPRERRGEQRGARRFIGPTILGVLALALLVVVVPGAGSPTGGPDGLVAAETGAPEPPTAPAATAPPCDVGDVFTPRQGPDDWARTILDTTLMLRADFVPRGLVPVTDAGIAGRGKVRDVVIEDLRALAEAARAQGVTISIDSAYRSFDQQVAAYTSYVEGYGKEAADRTVARPGHSEHQLGTTLDFAGDLEWLASNAPAFGFVMSYPPSASPERTCYRAEAWHYRYVGRDTALRVAASGLSLREWLWRHAR